VFDRTASTTTSMPARDGHLPSRRRGGILLWGGPWDVSPVTWSDCGVKVYCVYTLQSLS
jgi:hypothetical protein